MILNEDNDSDDAMTNSSKFSDQLLQPKSYSDYNYTDEYLFNEHVAFNEVLEIESYTASSTAAFFSDCVLLIERQKISVNKGLPSVHSAYFNTLFNGEFAEKALDEIPIEELDVNQFCQLLQFIYPGDGHYLVTATNVECLLKMGDRFDCKDIMVRCEKFLLQACYFCTSVKVGSHRIPIEKKMWFAQEFRLKNLMDFCVSLFRTYDDLQKLTKKPDYEALNDKTIRILVANISKNC